MLVQNWMSTGVMSIGADDSIRKAIKLQKEYNISLLPVMEDGKLIGIISDRDIKRASFSDTIPLDMNEAIYLASKVTVRDVMTSHPLTVSYELTMEEVADFLLKNRISGAPVVDNAGKIVGIITRSDALRVLISVTGGDKMGYQFGFRVEDKPGSVAAIVKVMREHGCRVASILGSYENAPANFRNVYIRVYDVEPEEYSSLLEELKEITKVRYVVDFILNKRQIFSE